jgi:hypothetical protein
MPVSPMTSRASPPSVVRSMLTLPFSGVNLIAFDRRLSTT